MGQSRIYKCKFDSDPNFLVDGLIVPTLPDNKRHAIERAFPGGGRVWCDGFTSLLADFGRRWGLTYLGFAPEGLATNVVLFAETSAGTPVVLKTGYPDPENLTSIIALEAYGGRHAVRLLASDLDQQVILMERVLPGTNFRQARRDGSRVAGSFGDSGAENPGDPLHLFASLPVRQWSDSGLPEFEAWLVKARRDYQQCKLYDEAFLLHLDGAIRCYEGLVDRYPSNVLLHGDLHHENILFDATRGWLAVDPKGVIGPAVMECGRFIHNFIEDELGMPDLSMAPDDRVEEVLRSRIDHFSRRIAVPWADVVSVAYVDLVVSTCWTLIDGDEEAMPLNLICIVQRLLGSESSLQM